MPSLTAYTPYETLAFFQNVARFGSDSSAFETIATALNKNQLIRESDDYDDARITAEALRNLYDDLLRSERDAKSPTINGDPAKGNANSRKRKLSTSPVPNHGPQDLDQNLFHALVDRLYATFREQTIREIRNDEEEYQRLQSEIAELEKQVDSTEEAQAQPSSPNDNNSAKENQGDSVVQDGLRNTLVAEGASVDKISEGSQHDLVADQASPTKDEKKPQSASSGPQQSVAASSQQVLSPATPNLTFGRSAAEITGGRQSQTPAGSQAQHVASTFDRTVPPSSSPRQPYGPVQTQHGYPQPGHPVPYIQHVPGMPPQMAPPMDYPGQKRSGSASGHASPMPLPPQQRYPGYPQYPQAPPPWPHHMSPQHQYQHPQYPNQQFYAQSPPGRPGPPYPAPHQTPYYPQPSPIHYAGQPPPHVWHGPSPQPYYGYPQSTNTTPVPQTQLRRSQLRLSGSSTPWKRPSDVSMVNRQSSPIRPDREVSPLTDRDSPTPVSPKQSAANDDVASRRRKQEHVTRESKPSRSRRAPSRTPSVLGESRSQSVMSYKSETPTEKYRTGQGRQKIKAEPPSTPAPIASDTDQGQRSSGRRGRPRGDTVSSKAGLSRAGTVTKRKRSTAREPSLTPSLPPLSNNRSSNPRPSHDPSLVTVSKNFARTSQLLLNEITSHKLAGIFAKPLSERDAPGYKELVFRPQDLKSIKAAVSKGGRAALAAIEALENDDVEDETPTRTAQNTTNGNTEGPLGNGMYLVQKTEELFPPKGIVNSSQLEMELVRMFANAVMFNPLDESERGFGRSLRIRKMGGDIDPDADIESASSEEEDGTADEGGIISDAREMFDDIIVQIGKWREVEIERLGTTEENTSKNAPVSSVRQGSASVRHSSVSSAVNDDDNGEPTKSIAGTSRKRRKLAET